MSIHVRNLQKCFNGFSAVDDVSFSVQKGEFVTLLGPSGSGKSTVLRCIAGLENPTDGTIEINREDVTQVPVQERKVGFVFQHYALFRHMNLLENIAFGLKVRGEKKSVRQQRAQELLELVGLEGLGKRMPSQLSGGQRQRVALARALAPQPGLLLLDEPFGALDTRLRKDLRSWLKKLHDRIHLTTLLVTHDQEEAFELSDKILVMHRGKVEQEASPSEVFNKPATEFVAQFVGETNRVEGEVQQGSVKWGPFRFSVTNDLRSAKKVCVLFRPSDVYVSSHHDFEERNQVLGQIRSIQFMGATEAFEIEVGEGFSLTAHVPKGIADQSQFTVGKSVYVSITNAHLFPRG